MENQNPTPEEIRQQLSRITASQIFTRQPSRARTLEAIIDVHLAGKPVDQQALIGKLTPDTFDPRARSYIRTTVANTRATLTEYYRDYGTHDPIWIIIPPAAGKGRPTLAPYTPTIVRSARKDEMVELFIRRGELCLQRYAPVLLDVAMQEFVSASDMSNDVRASIGCAIGVYLTHEAGDTHPWINAETKAIARCPLPGPQLSHPYLRVAQWWAKKSPDSYDNANAELVLGALWSFDENLEQAATHFDRALALAPAVTQRSPDYLLYLDQIDRTDEAIRLAESATRDNPLDWDAYAAYCQILLANGDFEKARTPLFTALDYAQHHAWLNLLAMQWHQSSGSTEGYRHYAFRFSYLRNPKSWEFTPDPPLEQ